METGGGGGRVKAHGSVKTTFSKLPFSCSTNTQRNQKKAHIARFCLPFDEEKVADMYQQVAPWIASQSLRERPLKVSCEALLIPCSPKGVSGVLV